MLGLDSWNDSLNRGKRLIAVDWGKPKYFKNLAQTFGANKESFSEQSNLGQSITQTSQKSSFSHTPLCSYVQCAIQSLVYGVSKSGQSEGSTTCRDFILNCLHFRKSIQNPQITRKHIQLYHHSFKSKHHKWQHNLCILCFRNARQIYRRKQMFDLFVLIYCNFRQKCRMWLDRSLPLQDTECLWLFICNFRFLFSSSYVDKTIRLSRNTLKWRSINKNLCWSSIIVLLKELV